MYNFYYPCGKQMSGKEEFVEFYSDRYYTKSEKILYNTSCSGRTYSVKQSSRHVEKIIDNILCKNPADFTDSDIALILAWKMGKINHKESDNSETKIFLHKNWKAVLGDYSKVNGFSDWDYKEPIRQYGGRITLDIKVIADYLCENAVELNNLINKKPDGLKLAMDKVMQESWQGIGPVYLITLLYFISNHKNPGKCPIYDRFAARALLAIKDNIKPGKSIKCGTLPDKTYSNWSERVNVKMKAYIDMLEFVFDDKYKKNRDIDRALWVYGHLFKDSAEGKVVH